MISASLPTSESFLLVCPQCWDCWARLEGLAQDHWWHRYVPCSLHPQACHPYGSWIAGSLLEVPELSIEILPPDLIAREFDLTINHEEEVFS
jgi:hypothetical protein